MSSIKHRLALILMFGFLGFTVAAGQPVPNPAQGSGKGWSGAPPKRGSYLGVNVRTVTPDRVQSLSLKSTSGVEVTMVDQDAPAGKAGIKEHDVILALNSTKITSEDQLRQLVRQIPPGRTVTLGINRGGQNVTMQVVIADRTQVVQSHLLHSASSGGPGTTAIPDFNLRAMGMIAMGRTGAAVEGLTPQLCEHFGIKNGRSGVLVRLVEKGSPADTAGLQAGDVIIQVEKNNIADISDWLRIVHGRAGPTALTVVRNKRELNLSMKMPAKKP